MIRIDFFGKIFFNDVINDRDAVILCGAGQSIAVEMLVRRLYVCVKYVSWVKNASQFQLKKLCI